MLRQGHFKSINKVVCNLKTIYLGFPSYRQAFWQESGNQWALLRRVTQKKLREARFLNAASAAIFWNLDIRSALESAFSINLGHKFTRFAASKIAGLYLHQCKMLTLRVLSSIPTSILADTATHCNIHISRYYNTLPHTATHNNTLQHTATHCNTKRHIIYTISQSIDRWMNSYIPWFTSISIYVSLYLHIRSASLHVSLAWIGIHLCMYSWCLRAYTRCCVCVRVSVCVCFVDASFTVAVQIKVRTCVCV